MFQYYDKTKQKMSFKGRPVLIIGEADKNDYNVLPVSRVTDKKYLDPFYDIPIDPKHLLDVALKVIPVK